MDIVKQRRTREYTLLGLVGVMALISNLPPSTVETIGLEPRIVMAVLGLVVIMALFLYVRLFFFLIYVLLAVGANLPGQWADALGITQGPLLVTLVCMVGLSLLNYAVKLLPTGLEPKSRKKNDEAIRILLNAIDRGNPSYIKTVLAMEFDLNMLGEQGHSPLMRAALRGDESVVNLLLASQADPALAGPDGTAADLARKHGHAALADRLQTLSPLQAKTTEAVPAELTPVIS